MVILIRTFNNVKEILMQKITTNYNNIPACQPTSTHTSLRDDNDISVINSWLSDYKHNNFTYIAYRREIGKFITWFKTKNLKLSELKKEDYIDYIEWLKNPPKQLMGVTSSPNLFPFKKRATKAGVRFNLRLINSLIKYLIEANYLERNPLKLLRQFMKYNDEDQIKLRIRSRILEDEEFKVVISALNDLPHDTVMKKKYKAKAKIIFGMLYHLGLRIGELSSSSWSNFKIIDGKCWFFLIGKGNKYGSIPVNDELLCLLKEYRQYLALDTDVNKFDDNYIFISGANHDKHMGTRRLREIVKEIFAKASETVTDERVKQKLANAFPHDLRHLLASDLDKYGISIVDTKEILRHSSERTTEIYRNSKELRRHQAIQVNKIGLHTLWGNEKEVKTRRILLTTNARIGDASRFKYFINAFLTLCAGNKIINEKYNVDELMNNFSNKATSYSDYYIFFDVDPNFNEANFSLIQAAIFKAASARGLCAKIEVTL